MASINVFDLKGKQVATSHFEFSTTSADVYLYADIDANYAMTLQVNITILDSHARNIGKVFSSGMQGYEVYRWGHYRYPVPGVIVNARAYRYQADGEWLGAVYGSEIQKANQGKVGDMSVAWSSDDEHFYSWAIGTYVESARLSNERAIILKEKLRPVIDKRMNELVGCSAIILNCFR